MQRQKNLDPAPLETNGSSTENILRSGDLETAAAFAYSWNTLPAGSVYSSAQVNEWLSPLLASDFEDKRVIELGCGNGSFLIHIAQLNPKSITGVDLGDAVQAARRNLSQYTQSSWGIEQADLCAWEGEPGDVVLCIGVLHHLSNPEDGFRAVLRATQLGGRFHCWVYGWEGNSWIRVLLEPLRRILSRIPPIINKYLFALPLAVPFFCYAKCIRILGLQRLPMAAYMNWISNSPFRFFWHVAFDQLVTPRTIYIRRETLEQWLSAHAELIEPGSTYIFPRNGNSWKFGGRRRREG